jgi:hypothetical protein
MINKFQAVTEEFLHLFFAPTSVQRAVPFHAKQHKTKKIQARDLPSTEVLAEKLQNVSQAFARLCCRLLTAYKGRDIPFYSLHVLYLKFHGWVENNHGTCP